MLVIIVRFRRFIRLLFLLLFGRTVVVRYCKIIIRQMSGWWIGLEWALIVNSSLRIIVYLLASPSFLSIKKLSKLVYSSQSSI
jgi:hypothetical protein